MKLKKGDKIIVTTGKDKGKKGTIERVYVKQNKVLIPSINMYKRHIKKSEKAPQGGIVDIPRPLDTSKVMLICPKCGKFIRVAIKVDQKKRFRICRKCKSEL
ncbi:50S ribosomal protein L24 [Candidatus Roizmanbacteria bacterium RIFCSPHIGHO2_01_FULL_39_12b]|uniref:Large ribosomal subunit protein uL24 n=1 Tax=Candidatus Roizmanbacteria bacterium RIFCSPHIGHO2_01_FULL_39_12b TaxID=1802030 RepID=A0A1F7GC88_9BACT|nr:MAG: 50S ribosomal protein L24 [Candidatus Roizmanbacteria bacterium RIFCSPHIGHO2_01_FULL_39_12b]OGK47097.1 MAG: 50S ribosomal protein L24 [Candidatus Roizmanbacteria bacterium RIFCSPLOWO2_01_FULL_39_19]